MPAKGRSNELISDWRAKLCAKQRDRHVCLLTRTTMTRRSKQTALPTRRSSRIRIKENRFPDIPFELIFEIAGNVADQTTLLVFRLVNRALSRFITPQAFSTIHAYPSVVSACNLSLLQNNPLAIHVRELVFQERKYSEGNDFSRVFPVKDSLYRLSR